MSTGSFDFRQGLSAQRHVSGKREARLFDRRTDHWLVL